MVNYNATSAVANVSNTIPTWGVFIVMGLVLFLLFKHFRRFIYGMCVLVPLGVIGYSSWGISDQTSQGNYIPITVFGTICATIITAIGIGSMIKNMKWVKSIEESLSTKEDSE